MIELLRLIRHIMASLFKPRAKLVAEILVLRQQLNVLRRQVSKRPQLSNTDRLLFEPSAADNSLIPPVTEIRRSGNPNLYYICLRRLDIKSERSLRCSSRWPAAP